MLYKILASAAKNLPVIFMILCRDANRLNKLSTGHSNTVWKPLRILEVQGHLNLNSVTDALLKEKYEIYASPSYSIADRLKHVAFTN